MNDHDFMRYSRQILLGDIAIEGQQKLLNSHVLIIGLGGLGSPAALYLAGAGGETTAGAAQPRQRADRIETASDWRCA